MHVWESPKMAFIGPKKKKTVFKKFIMFNKRIKINYNQKLMNNFLSF